MNDRLTWYQAVAQCESRGEPYVLVTVLGVTGSVPREPAAKMVVTGDQTYDTLGGGNLEFRITQRAREQLAAGGGTSEMAHFPLGASLGQCCGGSVSVLLEVHPGHEQAVVIFGAGHVAKALVTILGDLPWRITWVDERADQFPAQLPDNVRQHHTDDPVGDAPALCQEAQVLILTHNHQLDYDLCRALLDHGQCAGIGLIGSQTKADRFQKRLTHRGYTQAAIDQIRCPVGLSAVPGKRPMEVAVSIAAELLALTHKQDAQPASRRGLQWPSLRNLLQAPEDATSTHPNNPTERNHD